MYGRLESHGGLLPRAWGLLGLRGMGRLTSGEDSGGRRG